VRTSSSSHSSFGSSECLLSPSSMNLSHTLQHPSSPMSWPLPGQLFKSHTLPIFATTLAGWLPTAPAEALHLSCQGFGSSVLWRSTRVSQCTAFPSSSLPSSPGSWPRCVSLQFLLSTISTCPVQFFGWQTFKRVGASLSVNRMYKIVLTLSIAIQLSLFFMFVTVSLWIDQLMSGTIGDLASFTTLYKVASFITLAVRCPPFCSLAALLTH